MRLDTSAYACLPVEALLLLTGLLLFGFGLHSCGVAAKVDPALNVGMDELYKLSSAQRWRLDASMCAALCEVGLGSLILVWGLVAGFVGAFRETFASRIKRPTKG